MKLDDLKIFIFFLAIIIQFAGVFFVKNENIYKKKFLISSLILTILLVFVLVLKLHHFLRSEINLPNTVTYGIILLPFALYFLRFKQIILKNNFIILLLSLITILLALVLDLLTDAKIIQFVISDSIEELLRISGSAFWFIYFSLYLFKDRKSNEPN